MEITGSEAWGSRPYENHSRTVSEMKDRDPDGRTEGSRRNELRLKEQVWDAATESTAMPVTRELTICRSGTREDRARGAGPSHRLLCVHAAFELS